MNDLIKIIENKKKPALFISSAGSKGYF